MSESFIPEFNTEKDLRQICREIPLYHPAPLRDWNELAAVVSVLKGIYVDCLMGAVIGEILNLDGSYRKSLWDYREISQTANCVRLGAMYFSSRHEEQSNDLFNFSLEELQQNINVAYKAGRHLSGFVSAARAMLPAVLSLDNAEIKEVVAIAPESVIPIISHIEDGLVNSGDTLSILVEQAEQNGFSFTPQDMIGVVRREFRGISMAPIEKSIEAAFRYAPRPI